MKTQKTKQNIKLNLVWILVGLIFMGLASMSLAEEGGTWTKKADMPTARSLFSTCAVNGKIYAIGGNNGQKCLSAVEEYDPATDTWTRKTDMPTPRILDQSVSVVNGKIYAIGGWPGWGNALSTVEMYNPKTDTWTKKANMPTRRAHFPTCVVNGKIYAISGKLPPFTSAVEEYDPETDTWTRKANIPTPRARFDAAVVNGKIYAIGGYEKEGVPAWGGPILSTVEEYDPVTDTWTQKADMPSARGGLSVCAVAGKIYAIGGWDTVHKKKVLAVEEYDPATDTWRQMSDMLDGRECPSSSAVNGKIYTIGGWGLGGDIVSTVEEYTPEGWPFSVSPHGKLPTTWGEMKHNKAR